MKRHKAVIIGCGARGKAETLAGKLGVTPYVDSEAMIRAVKPDIVHIATPPTARYDLLALASDMGVPACTVEKPLAVGVPDWRTLCTLAERTSTKIAVCHQFRRHADFTRCREALSSGRLGRIRRRGDEGVPPRPGYHRGLPSLRERRPGAVEQRDHRAEDPATDRQHVRLAAYAEKGRVLWEEFG